MNKQEFIERFKEVLEIKNKDINESTELLDIEEFDSLSTLSIIAMIDEEFGKPVTLNDFLKFTTIQSLINFIGLENFE